MACFAGNSFLPIPCYQQAIIRQAPNGPKEPGVILFFDKLSEADRTKTLWKTAYPDYTISLIPEAYMTTGHIGVFIHADCIND